MSEVAKLLDGITPRQFEQLLYEAEKRGLVSRKVIEPPREQQATMLPQEHTAKADSDKPRLDLVPPGIIEAVGAIRTYGTEKYKDPDNWKRVEPERYTAALMRHLCGFLRDPLGRDKESGYLHSWHMACNIAFLIELYTDEGEG